jgi:hypothetical protein
MGAVQDPGDVQCYLNHVGMKVHLPPIAAARQLQAELGYDGCVYEYTFTE